MLVLLLAFFGGKRLRGMGSDVGVAIKELRQSVAQEAQPPCLDDKAGSERQARS